MINKNLKALVAAVALLVGQSAIGADFNFGGLGGVSTSGYSTSSGGIGVTIQDANGSNLGYYNYGAAPSATYGIGVGPCGLFCNAGINGGESLAITFTQSVVLNSLTFGAWDAADYSATAVSGSGSKTFNTGSSALSSTTFNALNLNVLAGDTLYINGIAGGSVFTLRGLSVTGITPVPVPAAAWLFISAIGGLVGARRLRRAA
ncbi:VPLPA-CTERM sorting domain-containing protein [Haliea sp. E17]|uniref:VPLPA-CTERM sorting domain-containing protein n=1 Tax=Haliea sp. E17 TaxID=3401576 RepID=UPI003AAB4AE6